MTLTSIRDDIDQSIGLVGVKHAVKGGDYDALSGTTIGLNVQPQDVDVPGLTLSKSSLSLTEGATDGKQTSNYKLKLNSKPKAADNPTITPTADASVATVSPATLTFTQDDWNTPKTVTVTAVDDEVSQARSKKATAVSHAVAGYYIASSEVVPSVAVTVTDDEAAQTTYRLHKDDGQFGEQRNSERRLTVVRSGDTSEAVTLEIAGINRNVPGNATHGRNGDWNLLDSGTTFSAGSATTDFRVELFQDEMVELEEKMIFRLGMSAELASVIEDDDTPALSPSRQDIGIYSVSGYAAVASRSGTWTVRLGKKPQDSVVVDLSIASTCVDMTNCNPAAVTISPTSLTFGPNNWNRPKTVTVAAAAVDSSTYIPVGETRVAEVVHTASGSGYDRAPDKRVRVQVTSPQASGQGGSPIWLEGPSDVDEGQGSVTYTLWRQNSSTRTDYYYALEAGSHTDAGALRDAAFSADLSFQDAVDAQQRATITLDAGEESKSFSIRLRDDSQVEGLESFRLKASSKGGPHQEASKLVLLRDNDNPGVTISGVTLRRGDSALEVGENENLTYDVRLARQPLVDVTVTAALTSDSDPAPAAVTPAQLTFTPGNWNQVQQFTVAGVNDHADNDIDPRPASIAHTVSSASGSRPAWTGTEVPPLAVAVSDDDVAGFVMTSATGGAAREIFDRDKRVEVNNDQAHHYYIRLATEPAGTVTVTPASSNDNIVVIRDDLSETLTFNAIDWATPQGVWFETAAGSTGTGEATISHTVSAGYPSETLQDVTVEIVSFETAPSFLLNVNKKLFNVGENESVPVRVWLKENPNKDIWIRARVTGNDPNASISVTPTAPQLVSSDNWGSVLEFELMGDDDDDQSSGHQSYFRFFTCDKESCQEGDWEINGTPELTAQVKDNEELPLVFEQAAFSVTEASTAGGAYKAKMALEPTLAGQADPATYTPRADDPSRVRLNDTERSDVSTLVLKYVYSKQDILPYWDDWIEVELFFPTDDDFEDDVVVISHDFARLN